MSGYASYPSLNGRRIFITGGATGIGGSMTEEFCRQGARVGFIDIDEDGAQALRVRVNEENYTVPWFRRVDVADIPDLKSSIRAYIDEYGGIDVLINNVANDSRQAALDVTEEDWRRCMSVNLDSAFFSSQVAIERMRQDGGGSIINFSSINALNIQPERMPGYISAKAGLLGLTRSLAREYGLDGIRVNAILPGWVVTERQLDKWLVPEAEEEWMKLVALKKRILPEDVARLALFLASDDSAMITNQFMTIDGGRV